MNFGKTEQKYEEIKAKIRQKKVGDKKKLIGILKVATVCLLIRLVIYLIDPSLKGYLISALWWPMGLVILSFPFYAFEKLLNWI